MGNWLRRIIKSKANGGGINLSEASLSQVQKLANHFVEGSGLLIRTKTGYDVAPSYVDKIVLRFSVEAWDEAANKTEAAVVAPTPVKEEEKKEAAPVPKPTETVPTTWKEYYSSVLEKLGEKEMNRENLSRYLIGFFEKTTGYSPKKKEEFVQKRLSAINKYLVEIDGEYLPTDTWKEDIKSARGLYHNLLKGCADESNYIKIVEEKKEVEKKQAPEPVKTDSPTPTAVQPKQTVTPIGSGQIVVSSPQVVVEKEKRPIPCNIFVDKNKVNEIKSFIIETLYEDKGLVLVEVDLTKISLVRLAKVGAIVEDEDLSRLKSHFEKKRENALIEASFVNGILGK